MVGVILYVEGGGDGKSGQIACREGFRKLLNRAGFKGRMPRINACGGRNSAFEDFKTAFSLADATLYPILLVDSEDPFEPGVKSAWVHLGKRDGWKKPGGVDDDQAQLMVQCMETWCVADRVALRAMFGEPLRESALPDENDLEGRAKDDVQDALHRATIECGRDRAYKKGKRSFELLGQLNPVELKRQLPHFRSFYDVLERKLQGGSEG